MKAFLKKYIDPLVPLWSLPPMIFCFLLNCAIYWITMALCGGLRHYDLTLPVDAEIPVVTEWIFIYLGYCYVFWICSYCYVARVYRDNPKEFFRFVTADVMSRLICLLFFIFLPTTNVRPEITGTDVSDRLTRFLYRIDEPTNLFPSIHCLVSWFCFVGIRFSKKVPLGFKIFSLVSALAIVASTQFLKQHYVVDAIGGILLAEICWFVCGHIPVPEKFMNIYIRLVNRFFPSVKLE